MKTRTHFRAWMCALLALTACLEAPPSIFDAGVDAGENVPPRVLRTEPAHQSTDVPVTSAFLVQFSEPMNAALVTVTLSPSTSLGIGTWNARKDAVTFTAASPLRFATLYTLEVNGPDLAGNLLAPSSSAFFTEPAVVDAGIADAGTPDAGVADAGSSDAGIPVDAGLPDAGSSGGWDGLNWDVGTWQ